MSKAGKSMEERQRRVIEAWLNNPLLPYPQIAALGGVSDVTFWRYRQDENFMKKYHETCEKRFKSFESKALEVLDSHLENGNFQAAKYILDGLGYKATEKVQAEVNSDITINIEE